MSTTVLVVDDELHLVQILSFKLKQAGFEVITADNGQDGYELARQHRPRLILTDLQMPVLSGLEMAIKLHDDSQTCDIPLIMLTARGHKIPPSDLLRTNVRYLLAKPFSARDLLSKMEELLKEQAASPSRSIAGEQGGAG